MGKKSTIFFNSVINKKELKKIIEWAFKTHGQRKAAYLVDQLKEIGFDYATKSGISISIEDLKVPPAKSILMKEANQDIFLTDAAVKNGEITEVEKFQKTIYIWNSTSEYLKEELIEFLKKSDPLNSLYIMAFSGARGNISQVRQLVGMRGLMSGPSGQIIEKAIGANFREGLSVTDYIVSSYGARKGLVDTAIKTADSGYLTRRLVEVAQSIIISELDCRTERGILLEVKTSDNIEVLLSLKEKAIGRLLAFPIFAPSINIPLATKNEQITSSLVEKLIKLKLDKIIVRSPLTCECRRSVCQHCYGLNLSSDNLVDLGETVGLIAAQSIGEPGTQLTMRTFHTGGIFTSEVKRQTKSGQLGYIHFLPEMKTVPFRTKYGQDALLVQEASFIYIINAANEITKVSISPQTLILTKNNTWVQPNDILFDSVPGLKEEKVGIKEVKSIFAREPGKIILEENNSPQKIINENFRRRGKKNYVFWVLSGQVFSTPFQIDLKVRNFTKVYKYQSVAESKIITPVGGFVYFCTDKLMSEVSSLKIQNSTQSLDNFKVFIEKTSCEINNCKLYLSHIHNVIIKPENFNNKVLSIGNLNNKNYQTKTGGEFYIFDFREPNRFDNYYNRRMQCGCTVFYVPKTIILTNLNIKSFKFKKETFVEKNMEIFPDYFINISGFITYEIEKQKVKKITIKPGKRYFLKENEINSEQFSEQVFFAGELILGKYKIETLSYLEVGNHKKGTYIQVRPITRYEITKENSLQYLQHDSFIEGNLKIEDFNINVESGELVRRDTPIQFISSPIILNYLHISKYCDLIFEFQGPKKKNSWGQIRLSYSEIFVFDTLIPTEVKKKDVRLDINVEDKQFVEPYTIFAALNMIMPGKGFVSTIKTKINRKQSNLILTTTLDFQTLFFEDFTHKYKRNSFLKTFISLKNRLYLVSSGLIGDDMGNQCKYHLGRPYLFSIGSLIRKLPSDYVKRHDILGQLLYERFKAGDIVQGLPKIEQILEARNPKNAAFLATRPGIINNINYISNQILISIAPSNRVEEYSLIRSSKLLVKQFQFIKVGESLTEGPINPHTLMHIYFRYFCSLSTLSMYEAAYRTTKKLQSIIFNSVQAIYISQGVIIADKHLELVIKQMTNKVSLDYHGETNFLPGDILDLEQAKYINLCIKNNHKLVFRPIVLGITRSSLRTDGFLAAASFQETTRVLTQAAMQGKTDWLRGLKENAITGRLIPAGTGFYANKDLTYSKLLLPKVSITSKSNLSLKNKLKSKQKKLKKLIRFKYNK
uniref:DNA-directed RNA polymerase n=1 Tax=Protohalopteris sp. TaxID=2843287 RepID=A0A8F0F7F5_9PHAE|nr:RNA polymerase beta'' subunit [Protohalopteris sp.]